MNYPSRTNELPEHDGQNQNPSALAADLTTTQDLNGMVNLRTNHDFGKEVEDAPTDSPRDSPQIPLSKDTCRTIPLRRCQLDDRYRWSSLGRRSNHSRSSHTLKSRPTPATSSTIATEKEPQIPPHEGKIAFWSRLPKPVRDVGQVFAKFLTFIGPGFLVAVAYIDPGNYSTDVSAGSATQFKLLFIVLMSNVFAVVLQSLAIRLGTVTGLNLAEHCKAHLPWWLNIPLYLLGEAAIIATDIAEVRRKLYHSLKRYDSLTRIVLTGI